MDHDFFSAFNPVSAEEWKAQIVKDLKGKPYESLVKQTKEGISVKPDYTEILQSKVLHQKTSSSAWVVIEPELQSNKALLNALNNGATGITLSKNSLDSNLLDEVAFPYIKFYLNPAGKWKTVNEFTEHLNAKHPDSDAISGCLGFSPLSDGLVHGEFSDLTDITSALQFIKDNQKPHGVQLFEINSINLTNAGASAATELGTALAEGNAYLTKALEFGLGVDEFAGAIQFNLGIGTDFFLELAKFRAIRILWSRIVEEYGPKHSCSHAIEVKGETATRYYSVADIHNNMIRATTMTAAAAIGGADAILTHPFDIHTTKSGDFGRRIARNVNLILQEESYLNAVIDPASGSYFIEELTEQLCDKAWTFFQEIEKLGGYEAAVEANYIQNTVESEAAAELEALQKETAVMVGVNKYPNANDDLSAIEKTPSALPQQFKALNRNRISESFELAAK